MWLSFVANVGLLVAKLYGFFLSNSYSVLASAADSLVDILSQVSIPGDPITGSQLPSSA